jgi:glycosyltransferase involved in cell wall biosynthesis
MDFSIVIPVFRGSNSVHKIYEETEKVLKDFSWELILVFDYGIQESWFKIIELQKLKSNVTVIQLTRNFGQHNATICGFEFASGKYVVTLDEDMQHNPIEILKLYEECNNKDLDVVYGVYDERRHNYFRNITSSLMKKMLKIGIPDLYNGFTSFRLIKFETARELVGMRNSYTFLDGYLTWVTFNVGGIKISHHESESGISSYTTKKLIEHSINIFITFSNLPFRILRFLSIFFLIFSSMYSVYIILNSIMNDNYLAGFPTIISFLGFGFSLTLFGLSVLGEYIQRINLKTTNRPNYLIKTIKKPNK